MKLLLVTHYMPPHHGGIERVAEDHARAAAAAGFEVRWISSREPHDTPAIEKTEWGMAVRVNSWNGFEKNLGIPYPLWLPGARAEVRRSVEWCDLVHAHDLLYQGTSLALSAAKSFRKPVLITQHVGFVPMRTRLLAPVQHAAYQSIGRRNAGRLTALAYCSDTAHDWVRKSCGFKKQATFLPNAVDCDRFRPVTDRAEKEALRRKLSLPLDQVVVLFAGRLVEKKGVRLLIEAAEPSYHLLLVGERGKLPLPLRPGIEIRPFVAREDFAALLRAVDIFALPSTGEGFPIVAQEAMASGIPAILGDDPNYKRQVNQGSAVLVKRDTESVRAAIRDLVDNAGKRESTGRLARENALQHWELNVCRKRLLDTYESLIAKQPRSMAIHSCT